MSRKKKVVEISSSFRVGPGGQVDEVTWTPEDKVLKALGYDQTDYNVYYGGVTKLREMAARGEILQRRNPEHGFWEYGPAWRNKDFKLSLNATVVVNMIQASEIKDE